MDTITWYADYIEPDLDDPVIWNRYMEQHIDNGGVDHFTQHPQIDSAAFNYFNHHLEFRTFNEFVPGHKSVVIIGLHGGWEPIKLELIKIWFNSHPGRKQAWCDSQCQIIIDYSEEGFTHEVFPDLWSWINDNELDHRILYVSSSYNVNELYNKWCASNRLAPTMNTAWYGFFVNWINKDREMCRRTTKLPMAAWSGGQRYMCLNRRPHLHRVLLTTLLERYKIINLGAVSMPKHFEESNIKWDLDIVKQWNILKELTNGRLDSLQLNFDTMYDQLPLIADTDNFTVNYALDINEELYSRYPINLISETLFFTESAFVSEKIWKPMLLGQIFLVMASPNYLHSLRELGFKTFSPYIDETYDTIDDPVDRAFELVRTLKSILALSDVDFAQLLSNCQLAIEHNRRIISKLNLINAVISRPVVRAIESYWDF